MLDKARNYIPEEFWYKTPVALKATAGLRLLPEKAAASILDEVCLNKKPFQTYFIINHTVHCTILGNTQI